MSEFSKVLRYIFPGLIFCVEYVLLIFFSDYEFFGQLRELSSKEIINSTTAIIAILATGGIGFIFSTIYHVLIHITRRMGCSTFSLDHLKVIKAAKEQKLIGLKRIEDGGDVEADRVSLSGAWRLLTYYWNSQLKSSKIIKSADPRTQSLNDLLHGTGAILVANIVSIIVWIITLILFGFWPKCWAAIFAIILFLIHLFNYIFILQDCEGVINATFIQALSGGSKIEAGSKPINLLVSEKDLKCCGKK